MESFLQNGLVLITGLPQEDWSEADIEKLVQPFGTPSHMILAKQIGKVCYEHGKHCVVCPLTLVALQFWLLGSVLLSLSSLRRER